MSKSLINTGKVLRDEDVSCPDHHVIKPNFFGYDDLEKVYYESTD